MPHFFVTTILAVLVSSLSACSLISKEEGSEQQTQIRVETSDAVFFQHDFDISGDSDNDVRFSRGHWMGIGQPGATMWREASIVPIPHTADCCRTLKNTAGSSLLPEGFVIGSEVPYILDDGKDEEGWSWYPVGIGIGVQKQRSTGIQPWRLNVPEGKLVYLGLRIMKEGAPHFAWLQVSVERTEKVRDLVFVVHEYAVALESGTSIRAGEHP